jgi:uncharacterized membrane protein YhaH (DUF805 family)
VATTVKPRRQGMIWLGWAMIVIGMGVVLFWTAFEAVHSITSAPLATILGVLVVLAVLGLLVPLPLILATKRARGAAKQG